MSRRRPWFLFMALTLGGCEHPDRAAVEGPALTSARPDASTPTVVVELFTSEGCSSCPPAEALARRLDEEARASGHAVAVIEVHVDIWDGLGWADPFASPRWTERQRAYARVLGGGSYTPEAVVDGRVHEVGSREAAVRDAIRTAETAPHVTISTERRNDEIRVRVSPVPSDEQVHLWMAVAERALESRVLRGENAGRVLRHAPVLRDLRDLGAVASATTETRARLPPNRALTLFVQGEKTRRIYGASSL